MMLTVTTGGDMCTFNLGPTRSLTVAENLVLVFKTWGGCFSMTNELFTRASSSIVNPSQSSEMEIASLVKYSASNKNVPYFLPGKMFMVSSWLGSLRLSWIMANWRICCILFQMINAKSSHHFWMVSKLLWKGAPLPDNCCSRFQRFNSWSKMRDWSSFNFLITSKWWLAKFEVWSFKLLNCRGKMGN